MSHVVAEMQKPGFYRLRNLFNGPLGIMSQTRCFAAPLQNLATDIGLMDMVCVRLDVDGGRNPVNELTDIGAASDSR
jgi:hypothetical protein